MKTCALLVTYNRLDKLKKSVKASLEAGFDYIYIINNASIDGTKDWLDENSDKRILPYHLKENEGGSGGFYFGLMQVLKNKEIEWSCIFDDDAYVDVNIIKKLQELNSTKPYQAYCSKVIDMNNNICKMNIPFLIFPNGFRQEIKYALNDTALRLDYEKEQEVVSFSFVGAFLHREFIKKNIIYLKRELFIYYDDLYFSSSANKAGEKILYSPQLIVYHDVKDIKGVHPEWKVYYLVRNLILGKAKYKDICPFGYVGVALRLIKYFICTYYQVNKILYLKYYFAGILDGLKGKSGKRT